MQLVLAFLLGSLLVGFLGRNSRLGFWGNFFASMLLWPVIGLLLVISSIPRSAPKGATDAHGQDVGPKTS